MLHLLLHILVPALVAGLFFRPEWRKALLILLGTMLVDIDHLLASPIYDPERCSIAFHPLHTGWAAGVYAGLLAIPAWRWRAVAAGCLLHLVADTLDCFLRV